MRLDLETEELKQMAQLIFSEKINLLEKQKEEAENACLVKDAQITELQSVVMQQKVFIEHLKAQIIELQQRVDQNSFSTMLLNHFLVLEEQKANCYMLGLHSQERALLGHFMIQTLPDDAPQSMIETVKTMSRPELPKNQPVIENTYNAPVGQVMAHVEKVENK